MSEFEVKSNETAKGSAENENIKEKLTESQRDRIIKELIDNLAADKHDISDPRYISYINELKSVYEDGSYKEQHSVIFTNLCKYLPDKTKSLEALMANLETLEAKILKANIEEDTLQRINNLLDIINLEISRYNFYDTQSPSKSQNGECPNAKEIKNRIKKLENDIEISNSVTTEAKKAIIHVDDKIEKNSLSSITALSVFSAVVLAFSGGMTVLSGVLGEMSEVSPLRVAFVGSLLGFVLFNTIFMLLYVVGMMTGKRITQDRNSSVCLNSYGRQNSFCRIIHRYLYVFIINAIFIILMYYSAVIYLFKSSIFYSNGSILLKIAAGILPFVVFAVAAFFSYQPFEGKIQQKRLYYWYKERILSILATNSRITGKPREIRNTYFNINDLERDYQSDLANSIVGQIVTLKSKSAIEKAIDSKVHEGFLHHILTFDENEYISLKDLRKIKRKIKTIINYLMSKLLP